jgi:hypothetical protein
MNKKTISINPDIFTYSASKTKKRREKRDKPPELKPLIAPNILKNKLLNRVKEHKKRETQNLGKEGVNEHKQDASEREKPINEYTDEFNDSLNYLQSLTTQRKLEQEKERKRAALDRMTVKNYKSLLSSSEASIPSSTALIAPANNNTNIPQINIELPEDLLYSPQIASTTEGTMQLNPYNKDDVPYGVLKGGLKPTYREWNRTHRSIADPKMALTIEGVKTERENRLNALKRKLQLKNEVLTQRNNIPAQPNNIGSAPVLTQPNNVGAAVNPTQPNNSGASAVPAQPNNSGVNPVHAASTTAENINDNIIARKQIIKKTIKRKYTLGRSKIAKTISVLIKDRKTRKRILTAQKDLKKLPANVVKSRLREQNLIQPGSNAPTDLIRATYENAMLAGEIININKETLLHNLSKVE